MWIGGRSRQPRLNCRVADWTRSVPGHRSTSHPSARLSLSKPPAHRLRIDRLVLFLNALGLGLGELAIDSRVVGDHVVKYLRSARVEQQGVEGGARHSAISAGC